jgi:hypothetical protein
VPEIIAPSLQKLEQVLVVAVNEADQDRTVITVISTFNFARERRSQHGRELHVCVCDHGQFLQRVRGRSNIGIAIEQSIIFLNRGQQCMEFFLRCLPFLHHLMLNMIQFDEDTQNIRGNGRAVSRSEHRRGRS